MAYDYTIAYLNRHEVIVKQILAAYKDGQLLQMETTDNLDMRQKQYVVNNLLASLALNYPEYADVRQRVRTWSEHSNGIWHLYVGQPVGKIIGGRPKVRESFLTGTGVTSEAAVYRHGDIISTLSQMEKFIGHVLEMSPAIRQAEANLAEPADPQYFDGMFAESGWKPELVDGTKLILRR